MVPNRVADNELLSANYLGNIICRPYGHSEKKGVPIMYPKILDNFPKTAVSVMIFQGLYWFQVFLQTSLKGL